MDLGELIGFVNNSPNLGLFSLLIVFAFCAWAERKNPRRVILIPKPLRWFPNLGIALLNFLVLRFLMPGAALGAAALAYDQQFGLFYWVEVPLFVSAPWSFLFLDMAVYYQHRATHAIPWLWKIHRVHHADMAVDVTTAERFHPLEALFSMLVKSSVILLLGAPVFAVVLYEISLNVFALFIHSNIKVSPKADQALRLVVVTPDTHRIHHSRLPVEINSNFGIITTLWDRLFGTFRKEPRDGQEKMEIGLEGFNELRDLKGDRLLLIPFMDKTGKTSLKNLFRLET